MNLRVFSDFVVATMKMALPVWTASKGFVSGSAAEGSWPDTKQNTLALFTHYSLHWATAAAFLGTYLVIMLLAKVPSYEWTNRDHYGTPNCVTNKTTHQMVCTSDWMPGLVVKTECGVRGDLTPKCSAARMVDVWLFGYNHMYGQGGVGFFQGDCNASPRSLTTRPSVQWSDGLVILPANLACRLKVVPR